MQLSSLLKGLTSSRGMLPIGSTSSRSFSYQLEDKYFIMQFHNFECTLMSKDYLRRDRISFQVGAIKSSWMDRTTQQRHSMLMVSRSKETYSTSVSPMFLQKALSTPYSKFLQCSLRTMRVPLLAMSRQQFSIPLLLSPFMQVKGWKQRMGDLRFLLRREFSVEVEMLMDRWFLVSLGYFALMLLLLFRLLFWMLMLDIEMEAMLCTGFCTTSPSRCSVVFIDLVSLMMSQSLHDRWDSMKMISLRKGQCSLELSQKSSPNYLSELKLRMSTGSLVLMSPTSLGFSSISKNVSLSGTMSARSISRAPQFMYPQYPSTSSHAMYSFLIFMVSNDVLCSTCLARLPLLWIFSLHSLHRCCSQLSQNTVFVCSGASSHSWHRNWILLSWATCAEQQPGQHTSSQDMHHSGHCGYYLQFSQIIAIYLLLSQYLYIYKMIIPNQALLELKSDFVNLAQCWLYALLYYHRVYPSSAFQFRTCYGVSTPVTTSPKLTDYVTKLFKEMENSILSVQYLEVELVSGTQPAMSYRMMAGLAQGNNYNNRHQKQTELKYFITNLMKNLQANSAGPDFNSFNFYIQFRADGGEKTKPGKLLDQWLLQDQTPLSSQGEIVGTSLKLADMNVIISRVKLA